MGAAPGFLVPGSRYYIFSIITGRPPQVWRRWLGKAAYYQRRSGLIIPRQTACYAHGRTHPPGWSVYGSAATT